MKSDDADPNKPTAGTSDADPSKNETKSDVGNKKADDVEKTEPRQKKTFWVTRNMAENISREAVLLTTFKDTCIYVVFVTITTFATIGLRTDSMYYLTQAIKGQFVDKGFATVNEVEIKFAEIKTAADFWNYAESLMVDSFYWEAYYDSYEPIKETPEDDRKILYENKLLGVPRIRQVKVRNDSCVIHEYFRRLFLNCYDTYSRDSEDVDSFGPGVGTAWEYNTAEETKSIDFDGDISPYEGGGFYQDLSTTRNESLEILAFLKKNLWITRGTRAIFVDFSIYNANLNMFAICKLVFEFPPTGGIIAATSFKTAIILYVTSYDYAVFVCKSIVYAFITFYLMEQIREIIYFKWRYFTHFWSYVDLSIICLGITSLVYFIWTYVNIDRAINKIRNNPSKYGNLEYLGFLKISHDNLCAIMLFFVYAKLFKYLNFNKTMGQLNDTLRRCAWDVAGFSVMFFIIFFAFAELGYLIFGSQVEDFSTFGIAMFTLLRTILGDFEYSHIENADRILAPIYFVSFIFFVFFVLINMFLAIINDTYADVKTEIAIAPDEMQMTDFLKKNLYRMFKKCGLKMSFLEKPKKEINQTIQQIREILRKCDFSDLEIEMFFARYNIDSSAKVEDYDVNRLLAEIEDSENRGIDEKSPLFHMNDFLEQQERLERIESTIKDLTGQVQTLISKLEQLENVTKTRIQ